MSDVNAHRILWRGMFGKQKFSVIFCPLFCCKRVIDFPTIISHRLLLYTKFSGIGISLQTANYRCFNLWRTSNIGVQGIILFEDWHRWFYIGRSLNTLIDWSDIIYSTWFVFGKSHNQLVTVHGLDAGTRNLA